MVQLPSMGKRQHAETAEPAMPPPPPPLVPSAAAVKMEAEDVGYDEHGPFGKRARAALPSPPPQQVDPRLPSYFSLFHLARLFGTRLSSARG
jgi:hypothetical protein